MIGLVFLGSLPAYAAGSADPVAAKKLYLIKCTKCHRLYDPLSYDGEKWGYWMGKMKKKSKLSDEQFKLISGYLEALRAEGRKD